MGRVLSRDWISRRFEALLPLAVRWAARQERRILKHGVRLAAEEMERARAIGVTYPERVRLLRTEHVPWPGASVLRAASETIGFQIGATCGLTLGYGIYIREDCWRQLPLIAHELVHTAQYERLGGIEAFLRQYLRECLTVGYAHAGLEHEARAVAAQVCPAAPAG